MNPYLIGILSALLTLFINFLIGKPGSKFDPSEIFSYYTIWLCKRKLKKIGLYEHYEGMLYFDHKPELHEIITRQREFAIVIYNAAEPFFKWEKALGMCSVCFGVWVSVICGIIFFKVWIDIPIIVLVSHVSIRLLNRFLYE